MHKERINTAKIGMVHYINTAPIHEIWKERNHASGWQLIEEHPAALNRMLASGQIDLGFVSSHEYGMRPEQYRILSDLSISANGPVGSVFLFSKVKPEKLSGLRVLLSAQSKTSVCLVRIILEKFFSATPEYVVGEVRNSKETNIDAILAIGDDALRLHAEGSYRYCLDLGEVWKENTGLPFVFAVCAVRDDFYKKFGIVTESIHRELIYCRDKGIKELSRICKIAAPRIPMKTEDCFSYLKAIEYDLGTAKIKALEKFFSYLVCFNEASKDALPLKISYLD